MSKLITGVLAGTLIFGGIKCGEKFQPEYQEGKVIKESGTAVNIVESTGAIFGNEAVKFGNPNYVLSVETNKGKYIISVWEEYSKPLVALAEAIEIGDKIKFRTNYCPPLGEEGNYFSKDRIGAMPSNEIELLGK